MAGIEKITPVATAAKQSAFRTLFIPIVIRPFLPLQLSSVNLMQIDDGKHESFH
jgi:hypothetical protein